MKRSLTVALVAVVALGAATVAAGAKTFSSQVKITGYSLGFFEGQVRSNFEKCEDKRGVELWEDLADPASDKLLGDEKTDASGAWSIIDSDGTGGTYYAVARNKTGKYRKPQRQAQELPVPRGRLGDLRALNRGAQPPRPGTQPVPASGTLAIAAASTVSATMSSGSRLWTWDLPQARARVWASSTIARR